MITFTRSFFSLRAVLTLAICTLSHNTVHTMVLEKPKVNAKPKKESKSPAKNAPKPTAAGASPAAPAGSFVDKSRPATSGVLVAYATPVPKDRPLRTLPIAHAQQVTPEESIPVSVHRAPPPSAPHASVSCEGFPYDILAGSDLDVRGEGVPLLSRLCDVQAPAVSPAAAAGSVAYSPFDDAFPCELTERSEVAAIGAGIEGLLIHGTSDCAVTEGEEVVAGETGADEEKSVSIERYICETLLPAEEPALIAALNELFDSIECCNLRAFLVYVTNRFSHAYAYSILSKTKFCIAGSSNSPFRSVRRKLYEIAISTDEYKQILTFLEPFLPCDPRNLNGHRRRNLTFDEFRNRIERFAKTPQEFENWDALNDRQKRYATYFLMIEMIFLEGFINPFNEWHHVIQENRLSLIYLLLKSRLPNSQPSLETVCYNIQSKDVFTMYLAITQQDSKLAQEKTFRYWVCRYATSMKSFMVYLEVTNQTLEDYGDGFFPSNSKIYKEYHEALKQERAAKAAAERAAAGPRKKILGIF